MLSYDGDHDTYYPCIYAYTAYCKSLHWMARPNRTQCKTIPHLTRTHNATIILYDYDSNAILVEGITSRGKTELLRAYTTLLQRLVNAGLRPQIQRMDNEVSNVFKEFLQAQHITLELTPAHVHRRNAAERAIRTWKNHFLAGLASLNPRFPMRFWSYLLPQSEITLNLLRQSRINP
jgi:hypothetical protein